MLLYFLTIFELVSMTNGKLLNSSFVILSILGDIVMCDDLADEFINVDNAKKLVKKCFEILYEN